MNTALTHNPKAHEAGYNESDYDWDDTDPVGSSSVDTDAVQEALSIPAMSNILFESDVDSLEYLLEEVPMTTINFIMAQFTATPTRFTKAEDLTSYESDIYNALVDGDVAAMHDFLRDGRAASIVAEVMAYYLEWSRKVVADAEVRPLLPAML